MAGSSDFNIPKIQYGSFKLTDVDTLLNKEIGKVYVLMFSDKVNRNNPTVPFLIKTEQLVLLKSTEEFRQSLNGNMDRFFSQKRKLTHAAAVKIATHFFRIINAHIFLLKAIKAKKYANIVLDQPEDIDEIISCAYTQREVIMTWAKEIGILTEEETKELDLMLTDDFIAKV